MNILGYLRQDQFVGLDGPQYYRMFLPLGEVGRQAEDIEVTLASLAACGQHTRDDDPFWKRDVITMSRVYYKPEDVEKFVSAVHELGAVVVLDGDDDLTETHKLVSGVGPDFCAALGFVDYVTVSEQPLADLFARYTQRPPTVLKNCVDVKWMQKAAARSKRLVEGLTIGFTGSPTHWGDWRLPAVPFARILRDFDVQGILHGEVPRYLTFAGQPDKLLPIAGVPFAYYPANLAQFDIALCAVDVHDDFNAGKSAVKALECMAIGVVPICSPFDPYLELAAEGAPVVIVSEDSQDGWYEAMRNVIEDEQLRWGLGEAGPGWVAEHRDMCNTGWRQWATFYRSIA